MITDISIEPLANRKQRLLDCGKYVDQVIVEGAGGTVTNRQVTLADNVATSDSPSADVTEIHYSNQTGQDIRYGGSGVTASTGGMFYNGTTMAFKNPQSDLAIYFIQNSGSPVNLDVVEFY